MVMTTLALSPGLLVGLIGSGIQASRTPALHEHEAAQHGVRLFYQLIDLDVLRLSIDALPRLLEAAEWMGFVGLNITYPCKQYIIPFLHELSQEAAALGSVNTVILRDNRRVGYNTDYFGFAESFRRGLPNAPRRHVVQLGAGGAGAAVAHALLAEGVERLVISDTDQERASTLVNKLSARFDSGRAAVVEDLAREIRKADGLVNCTPIGMVKMPGTPLSLDLLHPDLWVADIVYFPLETELLRAAKRLGCRTLDGGGMAVFQAAAAFRLFTGREPNTDRMIEHFTAMSNALADQM